MGRRPPYDSRDVNRTAIGLIIPERRSRVRDGAAGEPSRAQLVGMIVGTYREMPGLSLDVDHAARLFGLRIGTCQIVLDDLVRSGLLRRAPDGRYITA